MICLMTVTIPMGTEGVYGYGEIQNAKPSKVAHKVHLVSPRMDVDVTGVGFKRIRTQIIDHPRDEGLRQREQLWNYQQRYRGAVGKLKSISINSANNSDEQFEEVNIAKDEEQVKPTRSPVDKTSLQTRFRRRLSSKMKLASLRQSEIYLETAVKSQEPPERKDEGKQIQQPGIQRLYSSGLIVKNSLYKQIREGEGPDDRRNNNNHYPDNSRILEAIEKFGSLEKLPDISFPNSETPVHHSLRTLKSLSSYSRRFLEQASQERRITPLQRAQTITDVSRPAMKKIFILDKRNNQTERILRMDCMDSANEDNDDDDDDDDDEDELDEDYEDEYHNDNRINCETKHRVKLCDKNHPDHIAIRSNVTTVNTQDDLALIQSKQMEAAEGKNGLRQEKTFHVQSKINGIIQRSGNGVQKEMTRIYKDFVSSATVSNSRRNSNGNSNKEIPSKCGTTSVKHDNTKRKEDKISTKEKEEKTSRKSRVKCSSRKDKAGTVQDDKETRDKDVESDSDESLDIPKERFGHTTHSIERKLSIRKPWEWKPSPFRWIDKPYVRESDKPYIERVLNRGEMIDEFNYDSFARTKPLKVQNYPEHAGYKDRQGNLR